MTQSDDPLDLLPLDALHRSLGARMVPFAGYSMPIQYEGIIAEHQWTRQSAGLFDVSHMGQLLIAGEGLDEALEAILPGDVKGLELGRMRYSMLLNETGGILDDLMLTRWPGGIYMVVNGATRWDDIAHLHKSLPAQITVKHLDERALLAVQGPKAFDALKRVTDGQWPLEALTFMRAGPFTIDGIEAHISRSGYTGEDGFEISVHAEKVEKVARTLLAQPEVKPIGLGARDSLRLEAGLPLYGHDLTPEITPVEAALSFAISKRRKAEGGFPGADCVLKQLLDGPERKRVGLRIDGRQPVREGASVVVDGAVVGAVTSGGHGPALNAPIAMAYVPTALAGDGQRLQIEVRGRLLDATVVPMPFFPKNYVRQGAVK